ncbi:UNVERIFIED_CONTAM: hypothetical protein PYX00_011308 [Menopon gallinae]|uniref:NodB homology domain-containing protein n=1 Tax=Menopon gallinae TaxID=328185 RepID=A0AAW2H747_9NEOP
MCTQARVLRTRDIAVARCMRFQALLTARTAVCSCAVPSLFLAPSLCLGAIWSILDCCTNPGLIALTFDDGPTSHTPEILDMLDEKNCKATFHFNTNVRAKGNIKQLYRRAADEKHCVGLRVKPDRNYETMDPDDVEDDINRQIASINNEVGEDIKYARAPVDDGNVNENVYNALLRNNVTQTGYMYCLYDGYDNPGDAIKFYRTLIENSNPKYDSFIFLLHDAKEEHFPLAEEMIDIGRENGYKFVTLDQCLEGYVPEEGGCSGSNGGSSGRRKRKEKSGVSSMIIFPLTIFALLSM